MTFHQPLTVHITADLPEPGYDDLILEIASDTLGKFAHDGLLPSRMAVHIEIDYPDEHLFTDTTSTPPDTIDTQPDSAPIRHAQPE